MNDHDGPVQGDEVGQTLAAVVRGRLGCPWSKARSLCGRGQVVVDGRALTDGASRPAAGAHIEIRTKGAAPAPEEGGMILAVDRHVVVVDKPAGINSVPFERGERDTLQHRVQDALRRRFGPGPPLRVVQRLDRDTTGVLVFARNRSAERLLQVQFRAHTVERRYVALVLGAARSQTLRSHLVEDRGDGLRGSWPGARPPKSARAAVTHVEALQSVAVSGATWTGTEPGVVTLVSCRLETGRQHQIRIHLSEAGHPLIGERVYIRDHRGGFVRGFEPGAGRPMLHAQTLGFVHPRDDRLHRFRSPIPDDFQSLIEALGLSVGISEDG